jgi:hypothetical protein
MNQLQEITIKVPQNIAEAYNQANDIKKQEIINKITFALLPITIHKENEELEKRRQEVSAKLSVIMDKASDEAQNNGLTPEVLESILTEDE